MRATRSLAFGVVVALVLGPMACTKKPHTPEQATRMPNEVATKIEAPLSKDDKASRSLALMPELRQAYVHNLDRGFPAGSTVKIDRQTFIVEGDYGVVEADVAGQGRHLLYLARRKGEWQVFHMQVKTTPPSTAALRLVAFSRYGAESEGCKSGFGKKVPVLFVHGLNSSAKMWLEATDTVYDPVEAMPNVVADTFDYENEHSLWVDHPNIGPKLARRIACLANESRKAGGAGKVMVVAHSMGGLATRFAAGQTDEFTGKKVSDVLGLVMTIGTPHKGTPIADLASVAIHMLCFAGQAFSGTVEDCKKKKSAILGMQSFVSSGKVDELSMLPTGVPQLGIAGNATTTVLLMGLPVIVPYFGTDLVVPTASALVGSKETSKGGGTKEVICLSPHPFPNPVFNPIGCEHANLIKDDGVKRRIVEGVEAYLKSLRGPTVTFHNLILDLPPGWQSGPGTEEDTILVRQVANCSGTCDKFAVWGPRPLSSDFCDFESERLAKVGNKTARRIVLQCTNSRLQLWLVSQPLTGILTEDPPSETVLQIIANARWS